METFLQPFYLFIWFGEEVLGKEYNFIFFKASPHPEFNEEVEVMWKANELSEANCDPCSECKQQETSPEKPRSRGHNCFGSDHNSATFSYVALSSLAAHGDGGGVGEESAAA